MFIKGGEKLLVKVLLCSALNTIVRFYFYELNEHCNIYLFIHYVCVNTTGHNSNIFSCTGGQKLQKSHLIMATPTAVFETFLLFLKFFNNCCDLLLLKCIMQAEWNKIKHCG